MSEISHNGDTVPTEGSCIAIFASRTSNACGTWIPAATRSTPAAPVSRRLLLTAERQSASGAKDTLTSPPAALHAPLARASPPPATTIPAHVGLPDARYPMVSAAVGAVPDVT